MKYLIVLLLFVSCNGVSVDMIDVYLRLERSASAKVYADGVFVSCLTADGEKDTVSVPDGAEMKARLTYSGIITVQTCTAKKKMLWVLN